MLKSFSVTNSRNFEETITLDLTPGNYGFNEYCVRNNIISKSMILGKNGSGKTNFGFALFDIVDTVTDNRPYFRISVDTFLNADSNKKYATFVYEFVFDDARAVYEYRKMSPDTIIYESLSCGNELVFERDHDKTDYSGLKEKYAPTLNIDISDGHVSVLKYVWRNTQQPKDSIIARIIDFVENMLYIKSDIHGPMYIGPDLGTRNVVEYIVSNGLVKDFEEKVREIADLSVELDDSEEMIGNKLLFQKFRNGKLSFTKIASSGTGVFMLFYYWYKIHPRLSLIYMDEFDAFYHFEMAEKVVRMMLKENCQTIFTTHNTTLMSNDLMRPDCYMVMRNGKIRSLNNLTDRTLRQGHNLQKLYRNGEFDE